MQTLQGSGSDKLRKPNPHHLLYIGRKSTHSCSSRSAECRAWRGTPCCPLHTHMMPGCLGDVEWRFSTKPCSPPVDILLSMQLQEPSCSCTSSRAVCGRPAPSSPSAGAQPETRCAITQSRITTTSEEVSPGDSQQIEFITRFLFGESSALFHAERLWPHSHRSTAGSLKPKRESVSFLPKLPQGPHPSGC